MKTFRGFTLIEGIITLAIVGISFIFLFQSLSLGINESAYRSGIRESSLSVENLFEEEHTEGTLQSPYKDWKYFKSGIHINGEFYTKLVIISPKNETFEFYRWEP